MERSGATKHFLPSVPRRNIASKELSPPPPVSCSRPVYPYAPPPRPILVPPLCSGELRNGQMPPDRHPPKRALAATLGCETGSLH